jgi:uncharacterized protein YndB with AHSA1/START domain
MTESAAGRELVISRVFDAPRERVYAAFTDPVTLARWLGPAGAAGPRDSVRIDARAGGRLRYVMVSEDNPDVTPVVDATLVEVIENELIVGCEDWAAIPGAQDPAGSYLWLDFHDEAGRTRLALRHGPFSATLADLAYSGWSSSFARLDDLLAAIPPARGYPDVRPRAGAPPSTASP